MKTCLPNTPSPTMIISSLTSPRSVPFLLIVKYLPVVMLFNLTRLVPKDCISNTTKIWQTKKELIRILNSTYHFTLILARLSPPLNERSTSKLYSETRRELEQKYVPQLVLGLLLGKGSSATGLFFSQSLVTAPEVSAKVNLAQFSSRFWSDDRNFRQFTLVMFALWVQRPRRSQLCKLYPAVISLRSLIL